MRVERDETIKQEFACLTPKYKQKNNRAEEGVNPNQVEAIKQKLRFSFQSKSQCYKYYLTSMYFAKFVVNKHDDFWKKRS